MPTHREIFEAAKRGIKKLNERAKRESAAKREKIDVAPVFGRIRRLDPEPVRTAQDRQRAGR